MAEAVLTRELDATSPYATALAAIGLDAVAMPVTHTAPPADPDALRQALAAADHAAIVIASPRAATALAAARAAARPLPEVWAVGPATRRALEEAGLAAQLPAEVRDGASLAHALVTARSLAGRRVLVPRAEDGRPDAIEILRAAGAIVDDVIAYRTVPTRADDPALARGRALVAHGQAAVCAVFAPSQVAALAALVGPLGSVRTRFAAIGETTGAALRAAGVADVAVAGAPTPEGLATAIAAVYPPR